MAVSPSSASMKIREPGSAIGRRRVSMMIRQSPSSQRITEEAVAARGPPMSDHVVLLIQEWLTIAKLPATLQCFADEFMRTQHRASPALDKWYEMTQVLDLAAMTAAANYSGHDLLLPGTPTNPALLERIVSQTFARFRRRAEATTTTVVLGSKRPATAAPTLKFASKRSLPTAASSGAVAQSKSASALPSPASRRPKSAVVVAASRSTSDLIIRDRKAQSHSPNRANNNADEPRSTTPVKKHSDAASPSKATSVAGHANTPKARIPPQRRVSNSTRLLLMPSVSSPSPDNRRQATHTSSPLGDASGGDARPEVDEGGDVVVELEDMTEETLSAHFSAFSKSNLKKLRRVLAKSSAHSQELLRSRLALDKIQLRAQQKYERSAFAAKQTELLSTTMDMLIKEPCSLCRYVFLKKNLATKVSFKSICDLRASWHANAGAAAASAAAGSLHAAALMDFSHSSQDDSSDDAVQQATTLESTQQISHLYDEVSVCVFCAQLTLDFASYRPSSAQQRDRRDAARRIAVDRQRQRELQRQYDRIKCDPLDFHAYELNSDSDDNDAVETLEVDANGRVHVMRRPRNRRRTARTPAQTGLVSKRIHYDHLRSQSVHALNRQEWEIISHGQQD